MPDAEHQNPYQHMKWNEVIATLSAELLKAKFRAEGKAVQLQSIFKAEKQKLIQPQRDYTEAAASYNSTAVYLETLLRTGKNPTRKPPDLDETRTLFNKFEDEFEKLTDSAVPGHKSIYASTVAPIGDIVKVFDSIFKALEWFKNRHDDQRKQAADMLRSTQWRQWDHAGDPEPKPAKDGSGGEDKNKETKKDNGSDK